MTRPAAASLAITFFYFRDLERACRFYEDVLGLELAIDQGWSRIYRLCPGAHVGLVDEAHGFHKSEPIKPVQLCLRVGDLDRWHRWISEHDIREISEIFSNDDLGIRAFVFNDPEGYQIEIQTPTREGA